MTALGCAVVGALRTADGIRRISTIFDVHRRGYLSTAECIRETVDTLPPRLLYSARNFGRASRTCRVGETSQAQET